MRKIHVFWLLVAVIVIFVVILRSSGRITSLDNAESISSLPIETSIVNVTPTMPSSTSPTMTSTPPPSASPILPTPTLTPVPIESVPTTTPSSNPSGIGVIGDSSSDPYQCVGRGGPNSFAWSEVLNAMRQVDFSDMCDGYIVANSGDTTQAIAFQVSQLAEPIQNGEVAKVIIFIGANDFAPICYNPFDQNSRNGLLEDMLARLEKGVKDLILLGISPDDIYMVDQADRTEILECSNAAQVSSLIVDLNQEIYDMAAAQGINVLNIQNAIDEFESYMVNDQNDLMIDGMIIYNDRCDETTCVYVADGHLNTVGTSIMANALFAEILNVPRLSDTEILVAAGLK